MEDMRERENKGGSKLNMTRRFGWKIPRFDLHDDDQKAISKARIERQLHFDHRFHNGFIKLSSTSENRAKDTIENNGSIENYYIKR